MRLPCRILGHLGCTLPVKLIAMVLLYATRTRTSWRCSRACRAGHNGNMCGLKSRLGNRAPVEFKTRDEDQLAVFQELLGQLPQVTGRRATESTLVLKMETQTRAFHPTGTRTSWRCSRSCWGGCRGGCPAAGAARVAISRVPATCATSSASASGRCWTCCARNMSCRRRR